MILPSNQFMNISKLLNVSKNKLDVGDQTETQWEQVEIVINILVIMSIVSFNS